MKNLALILIFMFAINYIQAQQNLITNGSFEQIDSCYGDPAPLGFDVFQWTGCTGWSNPTFASSDLWCENPVFGNNTPPFIPGVGFQIPKTGDNIAGINVYVTVVEYREYIQNQLIHPLKKNKYYEFKMYVSNAQYDAVYGGTTSCLQVYFSSTAPTQPLSFNHLPLTPQIKNNPSNFYTDTVNWVLYSGIYKANGNEKYATIGCFENDNTIPLTVQVTDSTGGDIYFFIDDVSLTEAPFNITIPNIFTPNNDGFNDVYQPEIINIDDWEMVIYNRWGNKIALLNNENPFWDGSNSSSGTYFYVFNASTLNITETGTINLFTN